VWPWWWVGASFSQTQKKWEAEHNIGKKRGSITQKKKERKVKEKSKIKEREMREMKGGCKIRLKNILLGLHNNKNPKASRG